MIRSRLAPLPGITALTPHHCPETGCCAFRLECAPGADLREAVFQTCAQGGLPLLELRRDTLTLEDMSTLSIPSKSLEVTYNIIQNPGLWSTTYLVILPVGILLCGFVFWMKRRKL